MVIIRKYYKIEQYDILAVPKLNNMARAYSTLVVLVNLLLHLHKTGNRIIAM